MYQKEIVYMGLYKNGIRIGSAGFVKVESREQDSRLYLKTQNIPHNISGRFPIRVYNGSDWKELNGITIQDGGGIWEEELAGRTDQAILQIMLPGGYMAEGRSRSTAQLQQGTEAHNESAGQQSAETHDETVVQGKAEAHSETVVQGKAEAHNETVMQGKTEVYNETTTPEDVKAYRKAVVPEETKVRDENQMRQDMEKHNEAIMLGDMKAQELHSMPDNATVYPLKEDKWEQILDTYEQIHPYGDERIYVKIEPKDFVILQANYQHLVNNSFLLHGFYNYRYIILGKEQDYYLGVPGVFYEREKMVALMFGFEAFECPGGNVRAGEFGYYLRKVEL